jgi:hypothetical protein
MCRGNQAQRARFSLQDASLLGRFATVLKIMQGEIALLANALFEVQGRAAAHLFP